MVQGLAKEHMCRTLERGQQCGDGQREGGGGWVEVGKGREKKNICNSVNNKT